MSCATSSRRADPPPLALRIRRTYEQLEVIHAEDAAAIAIATRTPPERRPQVHIGPDGELLVWVPLPPGFSWPPSGTRDETDPQVDETYDSDDAVTATDGDANQAPAPDAPSELGEQDDERWEEALPLNGVNVGDLVLPAIPVSGSTPAANAPASEAAGNPFEAGRSYDWMKSGS